MWEIAYALGFSVFDKNRVVSFVLLPWLRNSYINFVYFIFFSNILIYSFLVSFLTKFFFFYFFIFF